MTTLIDDIDGLHLATRKNDETVTMHVVTVDDPRPHRTLRARLRAALATLYATLRRAAAPTAAHAARRVRRTARAVWYRLPNLRTARRGRHAAGFGPSTRQRVAPAHVVRRHRAVRTSTVAKARARDFVESSAEEVLTFWAALTDPEGTTREPVFVSHIKR